MKKIIDLLFRSKIRASVSLFAIISIAIGFAIGPYYGAFYCKGSSMCPTVRDGEWVIIQRAALFQEWKPVYGDIIIIESVLENDVLIKRVIGVPDDTIELYDGVIYLNGRLYRDEFSHDVVDDVNYSIVTLHKDQYWVVGDNRGETFFGVVKLLEVSGRVVW